VATFEEYLSVRGDSLVRLAWLIAGDRHRGDDLAQEVFARAYVRWRRISTTAQPDLYLRQMLINANRSWWRRRSSHELPTDLSLELPHPAHFDTDAVERDAMWRLMVQLSRKQREVIVLRYYEDLDDNTIATLLDCSAATVRTHARRALALLRSRIADPSAIMPRSQS